MTYRDWFFKQFPDYTQINDSYKDGSDEGLLQRYLRIYGLELDNEIVAFIDGFTDIVDVTVCQPKFLPLVAVILGSPPSLNADADLYRKVLAYAIQIYKVKGTKKSYELFLGLLGLDIAIIEQTPKRRIYYDLRNIKYDQQPDPEIYDSKCDYCSGYWVGYNNAEDPLAEVPGDVLQSITNVLCFLQPINAKFLGLVKGITITEDYLLPITDLVT